MLNLSTALGKIYIILPRIFVTAVQGLILSLNVSVGRAILDLFVDLEASNCGLLQLLFPRDACEKQDCEGRQATVKELSFFFIFYLIYLYTG